MAFNAEQLAYAGKAAIDFFLKNEPVDNINVYRPLIKKLMAGKKDYVGGLQFVVEQLRTSNDSNFQSYFGDSQVTYNRKRTLEQAKYSYGSFHDGFGLNEDELTQNGIILTDDRDSVPSESEKVQLTNLLKENMETLKLGFQENFDIMLHRDGSQNALDIAGLDSLISLTPAVGTVGGIDAATNDFWRNHVQTGIAATADTLTQAMEDAWRETVRVGGQSPDCILAGSDFFDAYRKDAKDTVNRQLWLGNREGNMKGAYMDTGVGDAVNGLYFKGVEVIWDPVFDTLDTLDAPATPWAKRCYFINSRHLKLRPIKGHWLVPRKPPRVYDRYVHYYGLTAKAALTTGKRNAHAVLSIA